ncbi:MAG: phosphatase PAP2 family protein [Eubacterium sp.]|nr:phosphatase PAP2 family protein [Eubacterium sp.]
MNYNNYNLWADRIRSNPLIMMVIRGANYLFTGLGFAMYPLLLWLILYRYPLQKLLVYIILPGLAFFFISVYRRVRNYPRPYEVYPIKPLIAKEKRGRSFPSRHVFSIMLIGGLWLGINPAAGILVLVCGMGLAVIRVAGGVHFPGDVLWGAVLGILAAGITCIVGLKI